MHTILTLLKANSVSYMSTFQIKKKTNSLEVKKHQITQVSESTGETAGKGRLQVLPWDFWVKPTSSGIAHLIAPKFLGLVKSKREGLNHFPNN